MVAGDKCGLGIHLTVEGKPPKISIQKFNMGLLDERRHCHHLHPINDLVPQPIYDWPFFLAFCNFQILVYLFYSTNYCFILQLSHYWTILGILLMFVRIKFCTFILCKPAKQNSYNSTSQKVSESHNLKNNLQILTILTNKNNFFVAMVTSRKGAVDLETNES